MRSSTDQEDFLMLYTEEMDGLLVGLRDRRIQLRDMAILVGLMAEMSWRSGKIRLTAGALAKRLGIGVSACCNGIKRLQQELVVARVKEERTGEVYFLINPYIACAGGSQKRSLIMKQFRQAMDSE
tara:strand:- start:355 stop:732 length:378 start_codon:yes stop_codon:yes gene_type:complete